MARLRVKEAIAVFKGCEKLSVIQCGAISPAIPVCGISDILGETRVSWLGDARNRVGTGGTSHTLDLFHSY